MALIFMSMLAKAPARTKQISFQSSSLMAIGLFGLFLLGFLFGRRRLEALLNGPFELLHVGRFEGFSELVVLVFGARGDSHPHTLTLECCDVYLPHVVSKSKNTPGFLRLL